MLAESKDEVRLGGRAVVWKKGEQVRQINSFNEQRDTDRPM
jgi:hypothetical protein